MDESVRNTQVAYDRVARDYVDKFKDELDHKPFDRDCLDRLVKEVGDLGPICDLGCGPGQIARYLHTRNAATLGVDLSPAMIAEARRLTPDIHFHQGDMLALPDASESWGGIAAFYSIIHIPRERVMEALVEMRRVLRPGGVLLITFHIGTEIRHFDEWWGRPVNLDFRFYQQAEIESQLEAAGFTHEVTLVRGPIPDVEVETQRAYIFARKPVSQG